MYRNILIVVPGFGECSSNKHIPQCTIKRKTEILHSNLEFFLGTDPVETDASRAIDGINACIGFSSKDSHLVIVKQFNCYDSIFTGFRYNLKVVLDDTSINSFLYNYITPEFAKAFDYIVLLLDDVEIEHTISFSEVLKAYDHSGLDIISPRISGDSHNLIRPRSEYYCDISTFKALEFYCYLMSCKAYTKYYNEILVSWNDYMWGYDFVLGYKGISCGTYNYWKAIHHCASSPDPKKKKDMNRYFNYVFGSKIPYNLWSVPERCLCN
jgi:hypothetical protein